MVTGALTGLGEVVVRMAGGGKSPIVGGDPSSSMGGGGNAQKEQVGVLQKIRDSAKNQAEGMKNQPRWWTKALKTMGIQMGIAGILKQSQIFTSTLGSLFQILGAFVDVMLAPWMPVIVPGLRKLANQIPNMRVAAQKFFDYVMSLPWGSLKTLGKWLANAISPVWWSGIIEKGIDKVKEWLEEKLGNPLGSAITGLGNLIGLDLGGMGDKLGGVFNSVGDKLGLSVDAVGGLIAKTTAAVGLLAATWTAAKLARYGLQATRWIPFVKEFTEPVRLIGKGIDRLFNKTAQTLGKGFAGLSKGLFSKLQNLFGKKPVIPKVPKVAGQGRMVDADEMWKPKKKFIRTSPKGGDPGGYSGPRDADDDWVKAKAKDPQKAWGKGNREAGKSAGGFADEAGGGGLGKPGKESKISKASKAMQKFKDWLGTSVTKITKAASSGKMGKVKSLVQTGMNMAASTLKIVAGTPFGRIVAKLAVGFLKMLPFLGASYMGMETTYDLNKIRKSDKGWTGDMGSVSAWMTEGKGMLASLAGEGKVGMFTGIGPASKAARWLGSKGPGPVGDFFKGSTETLQRWKTAQSEEGALSSGKALDYGIRAITGYGGAGASFLPILGQLIGGAAYEGGKYTSMGQFMDMGFSGEAKYGEGSFAEASIDKIMQMFNGMAVNIGVDGAPANAAMGGEHTM